MHFTGQPGSIEIDEIFFKGPALRDDFSFPIEHQARAIKHETVVAAYLIDEHHRNFMLARDAGQHVSAHFSFSDPERRGGDVQHKIAARLNQRFHGIDGVQTFVPKSLVVPGVFANGQRHAMAAE